MIVPDTVDALHRTPCLVHDVPFLSGQQVTDQRAILPSLPSAYRFKRPAGLRSAGQMSPDLQKHMAEERTPHREQMKAAPTDPAEEALAMKNFWPDNRINLISNLLAILDEDNLDRLLELSSEDQCAMCFAFMVPASKDDTRETQRDRTARHQK